MKDQIETALANQQPDAYRAKDESETVLDEMSPVMPDIESPDIFNGLHPNHIKQVRDRLGMAAYFGSTGFTGQLGNTDIFG